MSAVDKVAKPLADLRITNTRVGRRAISLVNPHSGLANDYLNIFNEITMLIENYPDMPEFASTILSWRATRYDDYFLSSRLPSKALALKAWREINAELRTAFLYLTEEMDNLAKIAKTYVKSHANGEIHSKKLQEGCREIADRMKECISKTTQIVNYGVASEQPTAQARADQIMTRQTAKRAGKS